jgi:hypothetical protein
LGNGHWQTHATYAFFLTPLGSHYRLPLIS